jgi:hypothetical protein
VATAASSPPCKSYSNPNASLFASRTRNLTLAFPIPLPKPSNFQLNHPSLKSGADALQYPGLTSSSGLHITAYNVVDDPSNYPSLASIDAILITGSRHDSFSSPPWILKLVSFTEQVLRQRRVRVVGVCFGHQIVGRAMGARLGRNARGWEASVTAVDLTKRGQEIFGQSSLVSNSPPIG